MKLKEKYGNRVWEPESTSDLIEGTVSFEHEYSRRQFCEILGRLIDQLGLSREEVMDIVDPHSIWKLDDANP